MALGVATLYPGFMLLSQGSNPALVAASHRTPVVVVADPADCSSQFDPTGKLKFVSSCDIAKSALANSGIAYANQAAPKGTPAVVRIGSASVASVDGHGLAAPALKAATAKVGKDINAALTKAGFPAKADPAHVNTPLLLAVLMGACAFCTLLTLVVFPPPQPDAEVEEWVRLVEDVPFKVGVHAVFWVATAAVLYAAERAARAKGAE